MANITGITVSLVVGNGQWQGSNDRLFLGLFGPSGPIGQGASGREFAIFAGNNPDLEAGEEVTYVFGDAQCCEEEGAVQAHMSTGSGMNNPTYNPLELFDIEHVYLRKVSDLGNDDWLHLDDVRVVLCDARGNQRAYVNNGELNFDVVTGSKHWLVETNPSRCNITVELSSVKQDGIGKNSRPAGRNWELELTANTPGGLFVLSEDHKSSYKERKLWDININKSNSRSAVACCGTSQLVQLTAKATEKDWPSADDEGQGSKSVDIVCTPAGKVETGEIVFTVDGDSKNKKSELTFRYRITARCV